MIKRILSLLLALFMLVSIISIITVEATDSSTIISSDGLWGYGKAGYKYELTDYFGTDESVVLPEIIDGKRMYGVGFLSDKNNTIKKLIIPVSFLEFGSCYDCKNLQEIYFSRDYEAGKGPELGDSCFAELKKLKKVVLPNELKETMLTHSKIELGGASYKGAELPSSCFSDCTSLTDITWPTNITDIGSSAFEGCTSLKELIIPDGVKICASFFLENCPSITTLVLPDSLEQTTSMDIYDFPENVVHTNKNNAAIQAALNHFREIGNNDTVNLINNAIKGFVLSPPVTNIKGDTNGDGEVNISDATLIQKWAANIFEYMEYNCKYMRASIFDFNGDGNSNVKDATALQKFLVGKE